MTGFGDFICLFRVLGFEGLIQDFTQLWPMDERKDSIFTATSGKNRPRLRSEFEKSCSFITKIPTWKYAMSGTQTSGVHTGNGEQWNWTSEDALENSDEAWCRNFYQLWFTGGTSGLSAGP